MTPCKPMRGTTTVRPKPRNALSQDEREAILTLCNSRSMPTCRRVRSCRGWRIRALSGLGSTFYRVLRAADQQHRRGRSQPPAR